MKKLHLLSLGILATMSMHASIRDLYNMVVDATEGQNLAQTPRAKKYGGAGKRLADNIRNQADTLITQLEATERATTEKVKKEAAAVAARLNQQTATAAALQKQVKEQSGISKENIEKLSSQIKMLQEQLEKAQQDNNAAIQEVNRLRKLVGDRDGQIAQLTELARAYQQLVVNVAQEINGLEKSAKEAEEAIRR